MKPTRALFCLYLAATACASRTPAAQLPAKPPESVADCLTRKDARLYGASWCHWCHVQLGLFGPDAAKVPYTDCMPEGTFDMRPECEKAGLVLGDPLPVWHFKDGSRLVGIRSLHILALVAGCPAP